MVLMDAVWSSLMKFEWVADNVRELNSLAPRHLGRPVTFEYFLTDDENNYDSMRVIGTLEGAAGVNVQVSGADYLWSRIGNMKVWRATGARK